MYGADTIKNLKKDLNGVPVVVAYHDLKGTPSSEEIANILKKEIDAGGDVAKIVVKPNSQAYVLRFLNGTLEFRTKNPAYPVIASASGQEGRITRLAGGLFGIDLTEKYDGRGQIIIERGHFFRTNLHGAVHDRPHFKIMKRGHLTS